MKKLVGVLSVAVLLFVSAPIAQAKQMTVTGTVTETFSDQFKIRVSSGGMYRVIFSEALLARRNGTTMKYSEILEGDKLQVSGEIFSDNSVKAASVRNMSLYPHNSTVSGKLVSVDAFSKTLVLQGSQKASHKIYTDSFTEFKKNGSLVTMNDLVPGMPIAVKGTWERNKNEVRATLVSGTLRLVNIYFTGKLMLRSETALTVVGTNNAIYAVDITGAKILNKDGKTMLVQNLPLTQNVRVWGKHMSGSTQVTAMQVKVSQ